MAPSLAASDRQLLLDAAAEIEGAEDAFGALADHNAKLKVDLDKTSENLQRAYDIIRGQCTERPYLSAEI